MELNPQILFGKVMHKRLFPKVNGFVYGIYYLVFPLSCMAELDQGWRFGLNRPGIMSFHEKDHGARDGSDLRDWARTHLKEAGVTEADGEIVLICFPRVFGYVFNPVSFWLCYDRDQNIRAVICEVNNTFGETHSYICKHDDNRPVTGDDWLEGEKLFHVSPFLQREGHYKFRFSVQGKNTGIWIDYFDGEGRKKLLTAVTGKLTEFSLQSRRRAFWGYPLVTLKAILLIHWQAIKLTIKGIQYVRRPVQRKEQVSITTGKQSSK